MSQAGGNRVKVARVGAPTEARHTSEAIDTETALTSLLHGAGNRAVAELLHPSAAALQRDVGWTDASKEGRAWNVDERAVGKIRRIPLEGLSEGLKEGQVKRAWKWDDAEKKTGHWEMETTSIKELSPEAAAGKAIVLVPDGLDATKKIEVLVFLHGFTESSGRPFAGWRTLDKGAKPLGHLREGADPSDIGPGPADVAPVRDVALDQAEQQLQASGERQQVIVLPQGGLHSQFGKGGDTNFDSGAYVAQIVSRLSSEKRWKDANGQVVGDAPGVGRISMAGHSGAGATLAHMADETVAEAKAAKKGEKPSTKKPASSALTGDLVLYDAINGDQLLSFEAWAELRLNEDLAALTDPATSEADKLAYLKTAPKLRGYTTDVYVQQYIKLDNAIGTWFKTHQAKLGALAPALRANYSIQYVDVQHEELMRGVPAGTKRPAGAGGILDAIKGLHAPPGESSTMPKPLAEVFKEHEEEKQKQRAAKAR